MMESLNPEQALDQLEHDYKAYLNSPTECRAELGTTFQRSINRSQIEVSNLRDVDRDYEQRVLHKRLIGLIELAGGSLREFEGTTRQN